MDSLLAREPSSKPRSSPIQLRDVVAEAADRAKRAKYQLDQERLRRADGDDVRRAEMRLDRAQAARELLDAGVSADPVIGLAQLLRRVEAVETILLRVVQAGGRP